MGSYFMDLYLDAGGEDGTGVSYEEFRDTRTDYAENVR